METSDKIITELTLCGYVVKEDWIPWIDRFHHIITVENVFERDYTLRVAENITDEKFKYQEITYFSISRENLLKKIIREIKKRGWPLEPRVLGGNWNYILKNAPKESEKIY